MKICTHQEDCPLLREAINRTNVAERDLRLARHEFAIKRNLMNRLYLAVTAMRSADITYAQTGDVNAFDQAQLRLADLDKVLQEIAQFSVPKGTSIDDYIERGK